ncbi:uncharacterized protein LOC108677311 isoform X1 [Hyalella azteca]|uniref:Uncharacterized protein LOC108677311 isoform X1 n=1 Tax=Hyalella azteca TaxID=294128 RepID=A0A8B7P4N7_HYAAZ|nr:uncharacterized protein LOC108677311 isoform X2 [Hyalella azteca]XP_047735875.1 uncharacterized protein LOC108677311 isoform X1 [Hyalella azteca]
MEKKMKRRRLLVLLIIGLCCASVRSEDEECASDSLRCEVDGESQCIDPAWICDDYPDCDNEEDEQPQRCKAPAETLPATAAAPAHGGDSEEEKEEPHVPVTTPAPEIPENCALKTCNPGPQFSYLSARVYRYSYRVVASTQVLHTSPRASNFVVNVDVALSVLTACELSLKIEDAWMTASSSDGEDVTIRDNQFLTSLKANEMRFTLDGGLVDIVCPRKDETLESLNFKRGLLSLMQNSMPRFDLRHSSREMDVLGTCDFTYDFAGTNDTAFVVEKKKDLDSCSSKFDVSSSVKGTPYAFIGGYQSTPVFSTTSSCRQNIAEKRIYSVECSEERKLTPFSGDQGGVMVVVRQTLQYKQSSFTSSRRGAIHRRTNLEYEFLPNYDEFPSGNEENGQADADAAALQRTHAILDSIDQHLRNNRFSSVAKPSDFNDFVSALRALNKHQLIELADKTDWGKKRLVFQDAVPAVGTPASVALMKHVLITRNNFERAEEWLRSLAFISRPTKATLEEAAGLLSLPSVQTEAFIGVGALVNAYCLHNRGCQSHVEVKQIMDSLHGFLKDSCISTTPEEKIRALLAIKGVGNAGLAATSQTVDLLRACITATEPSNEDEIRVAAVNSFRRFHCNLTHPLMEFFKDMREDSEVRIWSYLGMMRCADYDVLATVMSVLHDEEVNQVGSFVWTHLTNIQEGSLPSRNAVQALLSNQILQEKFRTDLRKFSRNYEWSLFYDPLNIGGSVEGNVVFSQKSYIPRSASLNFTTDLFGQSVNWLEFETRLEGFERPLENMFMGSMPMPTSDDIKDSAVRALIERTGAAEAYRSKQPELSMALRMFGNDVFFQHLHGGTTIREAFAKLDPTRLIERLNNGETLSLQKSIRPIESFGRVATSAGLPVSLELTGTLSLDVLATATVRFGTLYPDFNPSVDIHGTLSPSVASDIRATLKIDGMAAVAGVEVAASLSSRSALSGRINANGMSSLNLDLNMPNEKVEFINVTSNLFLLHGSASASGETLRVDPEIIVADKKVETHDCTPYADEIGATACWSVLFPNTSEVEGAPSFPLTGSAHLNVVAIKSDPSLGTYQVRYSFNNNENERRLILSGNTPGTAVSREHSLVAALNALQRTADLKISTPKWNFDAKGRFVWDRSVKKLDLVCQIDGQLVAEVELNMARHEKDGRKNLIPTAKIKWRGRDLFNLGGEIEALEKQGSVVYSLGLQFSASGLEATTQEALIRGELHGEVKEGANEKSINLNIDYNIAGEQHRTTVDYTLLHTSDTEYKFVSDSEVVFTQFPTLNLVWKNSYRLKRGSVEMNIMLNFGEHFHNDDHAVNFHRSLTFLHSEEQTLISSKLALGHKMSNIDVMLAADFLSDWTDVVSTGFVFQLVSGRDVSSRLHLQKVPGPRLDGSGSFALNVPSLSEVLINVTINETSKSLYNIGATGSIGAGNEMSLIGTYETNPPLSHHQLLLTARLPDQTSANVNVTALFTWEKAFVTIEVQPQGGGAYRSTACYTHVIDQLAVSTKSLELEISFPKLTVKISTDLSIGQVVTVTNRLQSDRTQDVITRLVLDILKPKKKGARMTLQWDPNRDPLKKLELSLQRDWSDPTFSSINATAFLGLLDNTYQMALTSTALKMYRGAAFLWEQRHSGRLTWQDSLTRERQEVVGSAHARLSRAQTAEFVANFDLATPFEDWNDNYFRVLYSRDADRINGVVNSRWHDDEFFDARMVAEKSYESLSLFSGNSSLDISSSFRGMTSLKTGAKVNRKPGLLDSTMFMQWEEDRIEVRLEGHDQSSSGQLDYSVFGHAVTSLDGYRSLSSELNLVASSNNVNAKAAARWDALKYELKCRGNRYSGDDYLNGEIWLLLPGYEEGDFFGQMKIFKDPVDQRHRLKTIGKWGGKTLQVEGHVTSERHDFHGSLSINTPFEALSHALLVLGKGYDGVNHKSEARIAWGTKFSYGFELLGHVTSITDFLVSASVRTPIERFKEVKAEIRHLFDISDQVRCHSRIFGQVGDKKYGLGGRYEQGTKPRIRVAFEAYTPLPMLELLSLDLSDNSAYHDSDYQLQVLYGSNSPLHLTVEVVRGHDEEDWAVKAELPLSILDANIHDLSLDVVAGLSWGDTRRLSFSLTADSDTRRKVVLITRLPPHGENSLEASLGGFITYPGYEDVSLDCRFSVPSYDRPGALDAAFRTHGAGTTAVRMKGDYRALDATFTSPFEPYRTGEVSWRSVPLSVVQEKVSGRVKWEAGEVTMDGTTHVKGGALTKLEADVTTPWSSYERCRLTLDNTPTSNGVASHVTLTSSSESFVADISYDRDASEKWTWSATVNHAFDETNMLYTCEVEYLFASDELYLSVDTMTPLQDYKLLAGKIDIKFPDSSYSGLVQWDSPFGSGKLEMEAERNHETRSIISSSSLTLQPPQQEPSTYALKVDLENRSTDEKVDLDTSIELKSSQPDLDEIKVSGTVRQVTHDPGLVRLALSWPNLSPVVFTATASHENGLTVIKPSVSVQIEKTKYGVDVEWEAKDGGQVRVLKVKGGMYEEGKPPLEVEVDSTFNVYLHVVDGFINVNLPLPAPWTSNSARIEYNNNNNEHQFNVRISAGVHVIDVEGSVATQEGEQVDGFISVSSNLHWNKHPLKVSFKQGLTPEGYTGNYTVEFPRHNPVTDTWTRETVQASLVHSFLPAGHKGLLTVHPAYLKLDPIMLDYIFEFPNSEDMTVQVKLSYKAIALGIRVEERAVTLPDGAYRRRFTVELDNPIWPFGVVNYRNVQPNKKHETVLEAYDLKVRDRKVSLSLVSNRVADGRTFVVTVNLPDGRTVTLLTGYGFSASKVELFFHFSWLQDQNLDLGFEWEDLSMNGKKKHRMRIHVTHPFRSVLLEANYERRDYTVNADLLFNWNAQNAESDVLRGVLQWQDLSLPGDRHYAGLLSLVHPSLPQDIKTNVVLRRNEHNPALAKVTVSYAADRTRDLQMNFNVTRIGLQRGRKQYITSLLAQHPYSNLHLEGTSSLVLGDGLYGYRQQLSYTNSTGEKLNHELDATLDRIEKILKVKMLGGDREIDLQLVAVQEGEGKWRVKAIGSDEVELPVSGLIEIHALHPLIAVTFENQLSNNVMGSSRSGFLTKKLTVRGGVEDMRNAVFSLAHVTTIPEDPFTSSLSSTDNRTRDEHETLVSDLDFYFRLNHTRLISSALNWRPGLREEIMVELAELAGVSRAYRGDAREWLAAVVRASVVEAGLRAKPIAVDLVSTSQPLLTHFKNQTREFLADATKIYTSMKLTDAEMKRRQSLEFIFKSFWSYIESTNFYKWIKPRLAGGVLRSKVSAILERVRTLVLQLRSGLGGSQGGLERLKTVLAETYDKLAKRWYLKLSNVLSDFRLRLRSWLRSRWHAVFHNYKPHIITTLNNIETSFNHFVRTVSGTAQAIKEMIATSPYVRFVADHLSGIKEFIVSVYNRPLRENLDNAFTWTEDVFHRTINFLRTEIAPFLEDWLRAIQAAGRRLEQYPLVVRLKNKLFAFVDAFTWKLRQIEFRKAFIELVAFSIENGYTIFTQTALDAEHRQRKVKTHLYLDAEVGHLEYVQKLPMTWYNFNAAPRWEDLKEWRLFKLLQSIMSGGQPVPVLDIWYKYYSLSTNPRTWLPPFEASSEVVGQQHMITWNGRLLKFKGLCRYLLAADLMSSRWAVVLNYHANAPNAYIIYVDGKQIELEQQFVVKLDGRPSQLPLVLPSTVILRDGEVLFLRHTSGLQIRWNQLHDVFVVTLPGIFFNKVGGLLGTNNYEPLDDLLSPTAELTSDVSQLASSWSVSQGACEARINAASNATAAESDRCSSIFRSQASPFKYCFYQVSPNAYDDICRSYAPGASAAARQKASCVASSAFRQACSVAGVPTKIPHDCSICRFEKRDGTTGEVPESQMTVLSVADIPRSTDVVILVEIGPCNDNAVFRRNFKRFLRSFESALVEDGQAPSRYVVVAYGGVGLYATPQLAGTKRELFNSVDDAADALSAIAHEGTVNTHMDPVDAFEAIRYAAYLPFRAGVVPTFLMMPCTACHPNAGSIDFATMLHILTDRNVVLHVLVQDPLGPKAALQDKILGMDTEAVYTAKDARPQKPLVGDRSLRRGVADPKEQLEYCSPLALQTNGTIFTSRWLLTSRRRKVEQTATALGRRVALTATASHSQRCFCLPTTDDSAKMKCHRVRPEWGNFSAVAPYFDEEGEEDYLDIPQDLGY